MQDELASSHGCILTTTFSSLENMLPMPLTSALRAALVEDFNAEQFAPLDLSNYPSLDTNRRPNKVRTCQRRDAQDRTVEHGMGPVLRTRSGIHRRIHGDGSGHYKSGIMSPKEVELLSIAFDASVTHYVCARARADTSRMHYKRAQPWRRSRKC
jgi:hypothetical protein